MFRPRLEAINRGNPVSSPRNAGIGGGNTTNNNTTNSVGDVTVQLESKGNAQQDARALGKELRRMVKRRQLPGF